MEMNKLTANQRLIIIPLLLISGSCQVIVKKISGNLKGFVLALPLPGWFFVVNKFYKWTPCNNGLIKGFDVETWHMPGQWCKDIERFKK